MGIKKKQKGAKVSKKEKAKSRAPSAPKSKGHKVTTLVDR